MKKIVIILMLLLSMFFITIPAGAQELSVSAKSAIVICADTKDIVFSKNINTKLSMASTTKIMTGLILAEQKDLTKTVTVSDKMVAVEGSSMGLRAGDVITYLDLLYGLMLASGNDAANTIAVTLGGSIEGFAKLMNNKAKEIGLKNTNFVTPSGLDHEQHYTTAYDLAVLTAYALENKVFSEVCSTYIKTISFGNPKTEHTYKNHNRLLNSYNGMIGVKTGFTKKSGRCLVTAAQRNGITLNSVTLSAPDDWNDHENMLNFAFEKVEKLSVKANIPESLPVISGDCDRVKISAASKSFALCEENLNKIKMQVFLPKFLYSEISAGEKIGCVLYYLNGKCIGNTNIISVADVNLKNNKPSFGCLFKENLLKLLRLVI